VLHVPGLHVVGLAEAAVVVDPDLGDDEDGDAARPRRIAFDPCQDGMDDVRGQIMVAGGDEALRSGNEKFAVGEAFRRGLQGTHVAPRARFGQAHGPAPFPGVHLVHILVFQLFRTETFDKAAGAQGEPRIDDKGKVGRREQLTAGVGHNHRGTLTAHFGGLDRGHPTALAKLLVGVMEAFGDSHLAVLVYVACLFVAFRIGGDDDVERHLFRLVHHHQHVVLRKILVELRFEQLLDAQLLEEKELLIPCVYQRIAHKIPPSRSVRWSGNFYSG